MKDFEILKNIQKEVRFLSTEGKANHKEDVGEHLRSIAANYKTFQNDRLGVSVGGYIVVDSMNKQIIPLFSNRASQHAFYLPYV